MKRIIFVLVLGLLVLGGCEATQQMDDMALKTSLEVVNEAMAEGKVMSCFAGLSDEAEAVKSLRLESEGCPTFETEEELSGFVVAGVAEAAKCGDLVGVTLDDGKKVYYDAGGEIVESAGEVGCSLTVTKEDVEVDVAGVETEDGETEDGETEDDVNGDGSEDEVDGDEDGEEGGQDGDGEDSEAGETEDAVDSEEDRE